MTSNTNNSDQVNEELLHDELHEELLYELLLYKKKDIIAIQKKLGMAVLEEPSINDYTNQTALIQCKKGKTLKDLFGLLFDFGEGIKTDTGENRYLWSPHPYNITSKYARSYGCNIWGNVTWGNLSFTFIFGSRYKHNSRLSWYCWLY